MFAAPALSDSLLPRPKFIPQDEFDRYQKLFNERDKDRDGYITGAEVRDFFKSSGLDKDTLSRVWNLSDVDKDGRLTAAEFTIGMIFIDSELT
jgi:Ca2+-binding EF-hand superfamily protein